MFYLALLFTMVFSYLLGSLNSSIIVTKIIKGIDIREYGSKNAGLTNVFRVCGKKMAAVTLLCDLLKGIVSVLVSYYVAGLLVESGNLDFFKYVACLFAALGHVYPVFYGFHGGKGALITATSMLVIKPMVWVVILPVFVLIILFTKYVSLGSITAAIMLPITILILELHQDSSFWLQNTLVTVVIALLIIYKHKSNIVRLLNGTENKLNTKKK